jgi:flagellar hook-basal body complex protein FliE
MVSALGPLNSASLFASQLGGGSSSSASSSSSATKIGGAQASFAATLQGLATQTVSTLQNAERVSMQGLQGKADTREVVDAVMSAEQSLQTAVAIRDKIVTAYLEVSRMAI